MILLFRSICLFVLFVGLQACTSDASNSAKLVGTWTGENATRVEIVRATLVFRGDGTFSAQAFPASLGCPAAKTNKSIAGSGTWKLDSDVHRINLIFKEFSDGSCSVPYLANVFPETGLGGVVIVAYPDGVDSAPTAIRFKKNE